MNTPHRTTHMRPRPRPRFVICHVFAVFYGMYPQGLPVSVSINSNARTTDTAPFPMKPRLRGIFQHHTQKHPPRLSTGASGRNCVASPIIVKELAGYVKHSRCRRQYCYQTKKQTGVKRHKPKPVYHHLAPLIMWISATVFTVFSNE